MSTIEKDIRNYISDVGRNLVCSGKLKKEIMNDIENSIYDYAENNGITDISQIISRFGSPEEVAQAHLSDTDPKKIKNATNIRKIIISAVLIALTMYGVCYLISYLIAVESQKNILVYEYESGEFVSHYENWREKNNENN